MKRLVLAGGGHAHLAVLDALARDPLRDVEVTLVTPTPEQAYSGMLPGLIAGHYRFEQAHIDLARLCQWAGVRFITGSVIGLDPDARSLSATSGPTASSPRNRLPRHAAALTCVRLRA